MSSTNYNWLGSRYFMTRQDLSLNIYGKMENLILINFLGKSLNIFYDKTREGQIDYFYSDQDIEAFIKNNVDIAWEKGVTKKDNQYFLNISSVEDYGNFEFRGDSWSNKLLEKQLNIYKPLIIFPEDHLIHDFPLPTRGQNIRPSRWQGVDFAFFTYDFVLFRFLCVSLPQHYERA